MESLINSFHQYNTILLEINEKTQELNDLLPKYVQSYDEIKRDKINLKEINVSRDKMRNKVISDISIDCEMHIYIILNVFQDILQVGSNANKFLATPNVMNFLLDYVFISQCLNQKNIEKVLILISILSSEPLFQKKYNSKCLHLISHILNYKDDDKFDYGTNSLAILKIINNLLYTKNNSFILLDNNLILWMRKTNSKYKNVENLNNQILFFNQKITKILLIQTSGTFYSKLVSSYADEMVVI